MRKSIILSIALAAFVSLAFINPPTNSRQINVVIDAAHGGKDFGGSRENITEKEIVAQIASKIKALNNNKNIVLHFTRDSDEFVELGKRAQFANKIKPDMLLSLHVNQSSNEVKSGVEIFIAKEGMYNDKSDAYAQRLAEKLKTNHSLNSKIEKAPFFILKNTEAPAMIVELGFLSNESDRNYLLDDAEQTRLAHSILEFIAETE